MPKLLSKRCVKRALPHDFRYPICTLHGEENIVKGKGTTDDIIKGITW